MTSCLSKFLALAWLTIKFAGLAIPPDSAHGQMSSDRGRGAAVYRNTTFSCVPVLGIVFSHLRRRRVLSAHPLRLDRPQLGTASQALRPRPQGTSPMLPCQIVPSVDFAASLHASRLCGPVMPLMHDAHSRCRLGHSRCRMGHSRCRMAIEYQRRL